MREQTIRDAYISVELRAAGLLGLRDDLKETLECNGLVCEASSSDVHVSIAYTEGEIEVGSVAQVANAIARAQFEVRVTGFEILEGANTPYDYLALSLESDGAFRSAIQAIEEKMPTRRFEGGFKSHCSLLRFEKGAFSKEACERLVRELNASQGAAWALGRRLCLEGECVCVFDTQRQRCLEVPIGDLVKAA